MKVANPGSALGEAIGSLLEAEIHRLLRPIAENYGAVYITTPQQLGAKRKKLILTDEDGNDYEVDAVITNCRFQPLVLLEAKYIRYKKHNRDKASWICTAHTKLRRRFPTVRGSIAVLMGSWSTPSKRLLKSFEVMIFEISFERICEVLQHFGIDYKWEEKERNKAIEAWQKFSKLSDQDKAKIAEKLINDIAPSLKTALAQVLDESKPRRIKKITVLINTNRGETFTFQFHSIEETIRFFKGFNEEKHLDTTEAPTLLESSTGLSDTEG